MSEVAEVHSQNYSSIRYLAELHVQGLDNRSTTFKSWLETKRHFYILDMDVFTVFSVNVSSHRPSILWSKHDYISVTPDHNPLNSP